MDWSCPPSLVARRGRIYLGVPQAASSYVRDLEETRNTDRNPRHLIREVQNDPNKQFPEFYVACGLQDVLLEANRSIAKALSDAGADVTYEEGEGIHDWIFGTSASSTY